MAYNMNNFIMGFLLADREKKQLEAKGIEVPKNFTATQGMLFGAFPNPHVANFVLQNEVQKRDTVINPVAQKQLTTEITAKEMAIKAKEDAIAEKEVALKGMQEAELIMKEAIKAKEDAIVEKDAALKDKAEAIVAKDQAVEKLSKIKDDISAFARDWNSLTTVDAIRDEFTKKFLGGN